MENLFGEPYTELPTKKRKPQDKERRAWENAFQRWSNEAAQDGTTQLGCCGYRIHCLTPECHMRLGYVYFTENDAASAWNRRAE